MASSGLLEDRLPSAFLVVPDIVDLEVIGPKLKEFGVIYRKDDERPGQATHTEFDDHGMPTVIQGTLYEFIGPHDGLLKARGLFERELGIPGFAM